MSKLLFCKDCRYVGEAFLVPSVLIPVLYIPCGHPNAARVVGEVDLITGHVPVIRDSCEYQRTEKPGLCGIDAVFFEPSPPIRVEG